ncbi:MAG: M18 family aminopeptidase [Desulfobacteraceae bacterium]
MNQKTFNEGLFDFLSQSPTSFHTARYLESMFTAAGFTVLNENDAWTIKPGGRYVVTRNHGALIAFRPGNMDYTRCGFRMIGAHTDSPGLKIKPRPDIRSATCVQLGVEVYGSPILNTWLDRELSIAGRASYVSDTDGAVRIKSVLVDFKDPLAIIPNLAIHLDREVNNGRSINKQNDLPPLVMIENEASFNFRDHLTEHLKSLSHEISDNTLLDYDLMLYDPQGPRATGMNREFITSSRLDNLVSCYCGAWAMINGKSDLPALFIANDHEEVGSVSTSGAGGNFLQAVLRRLCPDSDQLARAAVRSLLVSADNAHGVHPSYKDRYEPNHGPLLNKGPVLKYNANQRYATDSRGGAAFRFLCSKAGIPFQEFVVRSDMACGSTIGPVTSGDTGILTVDAGVPMLAMHSIRETAGSDDAHHFARFLATHVATELY